MHTSLYSIDVKQSIFSLSKFFTPSIFLIHDEMSVAIFDKVVPFSNLLKFNEILLKFNSYAGQISRVIIFVSYIFIDFSGEFMGVIDLIDISNNIFRMFSR